MYTSAPHHLLGCVGSDHRLDRLGQDRRRPPVRRWILMGRLGLFARVSSCKPYLWSSCEFYAPVDVVRSDIWLMFCFSISAKSSPQSYCCLQRS